MSKSFSFDLLRLRAKTAWLWLPHKCLSSGWKSRETILNFVSKLDSEDGSKRRKTMREVKDVVLDRALYLWFSQRRSKSDPISGPLLCEKKTWKLGGSTDFKGQNEDVLWYGEK
ncbi:jerky-like protein [Trichonephila clavipes]|nr:jerky-like protein [Trichonephila clavipes]